MPNPTLSSITGALYFVGELDQYLASYQQKCIHALRASVKEKEGDKVLGLRPTSNIKLPILKVLHLLELYPLGIHLSLLSVFSLPRVF